MAPQKKVSVRIGVEADNLDAVRKKLEDLGVTIKGVGNDNAPVDRLRRSFEALEGRLDPVSRATRKLADDEALLKRAVDEMGVSRERANALLKAARDAYDPAAIAARKEAEALRGLVDSLDKTAAAERKVADGQALLDKALAGGVQGVTLNEAQHRNLSKALREQHGLLDQSAGKTKLAAHEITNLSYQIQDAAVQLAGGQSPFLVLIQQGPQATGAVGGVSRALALMLSPIGLTIAAGATLAAGLALVTSRAVSIEGQLRSLSVTTKAYGTEAQSTAAQLRDLSKALYAGGAGRDESEAAAKVIATTRGLSATMGKEIAGIGNDMAAGMGKSVDEMVKQLGSLATEGYPAIKKLQDEIGFLTSDELKAVRAMAEHGQQAQALGIALEALHRRFDGLRQQSMSPAEQAFRDLGIGWNAFMDAVAQSRPVMEMITTVSGAVTRMAAAVTSTPKEQVADIETRIAAVKKSIATRDAAKNDGETYLNLNLRSLLFGTTDGSDLDKQLADLEQQLKAARGRLVTELSKTPVRVAGTSAGAASAGGKPDEKAVQYVDEQTAAYERLAKAMGGSQAARTLEMASMRAEDEIRDKKLSGQDAEDIRILRRKEALLQLSTAYGDEMHGMSIATQGSIQLAAAYAQSEAAALRQKAANDAQAAAAGNAAVSVAELTRQNLLNTAATTAADAAKSVADLNRQVTAQEKVAEAAKQGAAAQAEAERQAQVAAQTSGILAAAQVAEEEGAVELAKTLRSLAGAYDDVSKRGVEAQKRIQGEETLRNARQGLDYARQELSLMGEAEPVRNRALRSLQIQQQAQDMAKSATSDQIAEWVKLQEQIADTQALTQYANDLKATSKEIAGSISENLFDRLTDPDKATSAVDFFKSIFKRIAVAALESQIVLPIVTQVVGAMPSLFGIQAPAGGAAGAAGTAANGLTGSLTNAALSKAGGWAMDKLGITGGMDGLMNTQLWGGTSGIAPGYVDVVGSEAITNSAAATGGGATLGGVLAAGGAGALGGGLVGGYLGTKTNSKVVGGATGALAGAGAGYLSTVIGLSSLGGPVGAAIGAVVGLIMGMIGTQKATVGPTASADITIKAGGKSASAENFLVDNDGKIEDAQNLGTAFSTIFSAATIGGGTLAKNFGIGRTAAKGLYVSGSVPYQEFGTGEDALGRLLRYTLLDAGGLKDAGPNVTKAIQNTKASSYEDAAKDIALGASIDAGVTALAALDKSLSSFTKSAKDATAEAMKPMLDEFDRAKKLGLGAEYVGLATNQLMAYLDELRNPVDYTQREQEMAALTGQFAAIRDAVAQVNPEMAAYVDQIEKETRARIKAQTLKEYTSELYAAQGRDYLNTLAGITDNGAIVRRNLVAAGVDGADTKAADLVTSQLKTALSGLNLAQLSDVTRTLGGDVGALAETMRVAAQATASEDLTVRSLTAQGRSTDADALQLRLTQEREFAQAIKDGYDAAYLGGLRYVQGLERETAAKEKAAALAAYTADLESRMYVAVGRDRDSGLLALQQQQAKELADAKAAGYAVDRLQQVQAAEYAAKAFELAQADVLGAMDQQIAAQQDYITTLTDGAAKLVQSAQQFRQAYDALAINDNSPLNAFDRLKEARRQVQAAYDTYKSSTATDDARDQAKQNLLSLVPTLVQLARGYFGATDTTDYDWGRSILAEFGDAKALGVDGTQKELETAQDTLKEMQKARADAAAIGAKQYGALSDLKSIMAQSYSIWQAALTPLQQLTGTKSGATLDQMLAGLSTGTLPGIMQWARAQGPDTAYQVIRAADEKLGWANNPYRYSASADVASLGDKVSTEDWLSILRSVGYSGDANPWAVNSWLAAYGKSGDYEAAMRAWAKQHNVAGFASGGVIPHIPGLSRLGVDSVPLIGMPGEGVVSLRGMDLLGVDGLAALNAGRWPANDRTGKVAAFRASSGSTGTDNGAAILAELRRQNVLLERLIGATENGDADNASATRDSTAELKKVFGNRAGRLDPVGSRLRTANG
ncbi:phage tail length tape measure family protein [Azospirillum endophyticum]